MASATGAGSELLQHFWDLAAVDPEQRVKAAQGLLAVLEKSRTAGTLEHDLQYTLKRLIRGLASARAGARQGFALALAELLHAAPSVSIGDVRTLIDENMRTEGAKSQEERHIFFGRVFGYLAIARSDRLPTADSETLESIIKDLVSLYNKKAFLKPLSATVICNIIATLPKDAFNKSVLPQILPLLDVEVSDATPEALAIVLSIRKAYGSSVSLKHWPSKDVLAHNVSQLSQVLKETTSVHPQIHFVWDLISEELLAALKKDVKEGSVLLQDFWRQVVDEGLFTSSNERKFLGMQLLARLITRLPPSALPFVFTRNFMRCFITHLSDKKHLLYAASRALLDTVISAAEKDPAACVALVVQLITGHGSAQFDKLTKTKTVSTLVSKMDEAGVNQYTDFLMDTFIKPDTEPRKKPQTATEGEKPAPTSQEDTPEKRAERRRIWSLSQLQMLHHSASIPHSDEWAMRVLRFLCIHAFFDIVKADKKSPADLRVIPEPPVNEATHKDCTVRFFALLGDVAGEKAKGKKEDESSAPSTSSAPATGTDSLAYKIFAEQSAIGKLKVVERLHEIDEESQFALDQLTSDVAKCHKLAAASSDKKELQQLNAFASLFVHSGLLAVSDPEEFVPILADLHECFARFFDKKPTKGSKKAKAEEEETTEPIVVLTDVLLALLARPSHTLRTVCNAAFRALSSQLNKEALQLLLNVLGRTDGAPEEEDDDMQPFSGSDDSDDDSEDDDEDSDDDDSESDDDRVDPVAKKAQRQQENAQRKGKSDGKKKEGEVVKADEKPQKGGKKGEKKSEAAPEPAKKGDKKAAVPVPTPKKGKKEPESESESEDSSDEEPADDEEMARMDEHLVKMFGEMKRTKAQQKDSRQESVHFKQRVLELLDTYLRSEPQSPLIFDMFEPLFNAAIASSSAPADRPLFDRLTNLIKTRLTHPKEMYKGDAVSAESLNAMIGTLFGAIKKAPSAQLAVIGSSMVLFLIRVLISMKPAVEAPPPSTKKKSKKEVDSVVAPAPAAPFGKLDVDAILKLYTEAWAKYMTRARSHVNTKFFTDFCLRYPAFGLKLAPTLIDGAMKGRTSFVKAETYKVLNTLFQQPSLQEVTLAELVPVGKSLSALVIDQISKIDSDKPERTRAAIGAMLSFKRVLDKKHAGKASEAIDIEPMLSGLQGFVAKPSQKQGLRQDVLRLHKAFGQEVSFPKEERPAKKAKVEVTPEKKKGKKSKDEKKHKKEKKVEESGKSKRKADEEAVVESAPTESKKEKKKSKKSADAEPQFVQLGEPPKEDKPKKEKKEKKSKSSEPEPQFVRLGEPPKEEKKKSKKTKAESAEPQFVQLGEPPAEERKSKKVKSSQLEQAAVKGFEQFVKHADAKAAEQPKKKEHKKEKRKHED